MKKTLRDYQIAAVNAAIDYLEKHQATLIHLFTGGGKTAITQAIIERRFPPKTHRVLFIAGVNIALAEQTRDTFKEEFPEWGKVPAAAFTHNNTIHVPSIGLYIGKHKQASSRIIVASIQTLVDKSGSVELGTYEARPIEKSDFEVRNGCVKIARGSKRKFLISPELDKILEHGLIDLWVHDEAHHAPADGSSTIIARLRQLYSLIGHKLYVLGNTATPARTDMRNMQSIFKGVCFTMPIEAGVARGFLTPLAEPLRVGFETEKQGLKTIEVGTIAQQLADIYEDTAKNRHCTFIYIGKHGEKNFLEISQELHAILHNRGYKFAILFDQGGYDENLEFFQNKERAKMLDKARKGELHGIINFNVLIEGIDVPIADAVILARNVNDLTLTQILGRIMRKHPSKVDALLVDAMGQDLYVATQASLLGVDYDPFEKADLFQKALIEAIRALKQCIDENGEEEVLTVAVDIGTNMCRLPKNTVTYYLGHALSEDTTGLNKEALRLLRLTVAFFLNEDKIKDLREIVAVPDSVVGADRIYTIAEIKRRTQNDWHIVQGVMTMSISPGKGLVVHPPNFTEANRVKETLDNPNKKLSERERKQLEIIYEFLANFTAWQVSWENNQKTIIRNGWIDKDEELVQLLIRIEDLVRDMPDYTPILAGKNQAWKKSTEAVSEPQRKFLTALGVSQEEIKSLTKANASRTITHLQAVSVLKPLFSQFTQIKEALCTNN